MTTPLSTRSTLVPVLVAGAAAQFADDALFAFVPTIPFVPSLLAIVLTAAAARLVTRRLEGPAVPRTGLAVGAVSAGLGLLFGGLGLIAILVAGLTVVAGVAGAVAGRPEVRP